MSFRGPTPNARAYQAIHRRLVLSIGLLLLIAAVVAPNGRHQGERDAWARVGEACP